MKQNVVRQNISMYPDEWAIVERVSATLHLKNNSAALRHIIHEYKRLVNQLPLPLAAANPTQERES